MNKTLITLGEWYSEKFRKYYTLEFEKETINRIKRTSIKKVGWRFCTDLIKDGYLTCFKRDVQVGKAKTYFRRTYPLMEEIVESPSEEHLQSFSKQVEKLGGFVRKVQVLELVEGYLNNGLIDIAFVQYFKNIENYIQFSRDFINSYKDWVTYRNSTDEFTDKQAEKRIKTLEVLSEVKPHIDKKLFGECYKEYANSF